VEILWVIPRLERGAPVVLKLAGREYGGGLGGTSC
jgi:hypothetical protein